MRLPPGVSSKEFSAAIQQFESAIGKDWVFTADADVTLYRDPYSPFRGDEQEEKVPSAAVAPASVEEVQAVVRIANQYKIPLWPVSTGKNLGYGGASPALSGTAILDLKRMNRILEVNDRNHYALVEPGVSYFDLYRYIQENTLKVWIDPPDPGWGSLIGNTLERGGGRTPMHEHYAWQCGLEVVLPNGELVRTGMGALPGSKTWQQYKYGFGPYVDGLFSQSSLGVVTKMGVWLMPEPEAYRAGTASVPRHDDLIPFVDTLAYLRNSQIVQGMFSVSSPLLFYRRSHGGSILDVPNGPSVEEMERIGREKNLPYWSADLRFYGPEKVVAAQWEHAKQKLSAIPGATFTDNRAFKFPLPADLHDKVTLPEFGIPSLSVFGLLQPSSWGHLGFSPIAPMSGEALFEVLKVFGQAYTDLGVQPKDQVFAFPTTYFARCFVLLFIFALEQDAEANRKSREVYKRLVQVGAEHGWGEYRTHVGFMSDVMRTYSFNNYSLLHLHETIKDALDPNGILSPGKNGIWPKRLRPAPHSA